MNFFEVSKIPPKNPRTKKESYSIIVVAKQ